MRSSSTIFPIRLAALLTATGLNQRDFAERVGITEAALSQLLNGVRDPAVSTLLKINKCTGASIDRLFGIGE